MTENENNEYQALLPDCDCKSGGIIMYNNKPVCRWCRKPYGNGGIMYYLPEHFQTEPSIVPEKIELVAYIISNHKNGKLSLAQNAEYLQGQINKQMEDTWKAARLIDVKMLGDIEVNKTFVYKSISDYKATLPVEQVPSDKVILPASFGNSSLCKDKPPVSKHEFYERTDDNPFVWTDELAMEFADNLPVDEMSNYGHIIQFKKSKQSPTNLQESNALQGEVPHHLYDAKDLTNHTSTISGEQGWEILECFNIGGSGNHKFQKHENNPLGEGCIKKGCPIKSVKRISDGCVFSIGDKVEYGSISLKSTQMKINVTTIDKFEITQGDMWAFGKNGFFIAPLNKLRKPTNEKTDTISSKPVLFTEDNMKMIFRNAVNAVRQSILENIKWDKVNECCERTIENIKNPEKLKQ